MAKRLELSFTKMQGAGNDYIYMDGIKNTTFRTLSPDLYPDLARKVSDRHFGVGSDGLILILPSADADFLMRIFNADGSEAQMCGNGIRCVAKYVYEKGLTAKKELRIETLGGLKIIKLETDGQQVTSIKVDMGKPELKPEKVPVKTFQGEKVVSEELNVCGQPVKITAVSMGNPHCVVFVDEITDDHVFKLGPEIEGNEIFPEKANVEFIKVAGKKNLEMRVWERGSGETLACGTGACAATMAAILNGYTEEEVEVKLLGGSLQIEYDSETGHVFMSGGGEFIADGVYYYDMVEETAE